MKYKNNTDHNLHVWGPRIVGPHEEFFMADHEEREVQVKRLLEIGHISPILAEGEDRVEFSPNGRRLIFTEPRAEKAPKAVSEPEEKVNLSPIVDAVLDAAEQGAETAAEEAIVNALEGKDGESQDENIAPKDEPTTSPAEEPTVETPAEDKSSTETEADTQTKPTKSKKASK